MTAIPLPKSAKRPLWLVLAATAALAWNLFGLWQFGGFLTQTNESLMAQGMTEAQALAYNGMPAWVTMAFAVGVIGGALGTALLLLQRHAAMAVLGVSLVGYIALFVGDWAYGLFEVLPSQLAILSTVVGIAAASLGLALFAVKRDILR